MLAAGADALEKLRETQPSQDWSWVPKVLSVVAIVALYFGSRSLNRYRTSKEARGAAVQGLGQVLDPTQAREMVNRHHEACFDAYYQTSWGRRQSAKFQTDRYAKCVLDKVMADLDRESTALLRAARSAAPPRRVTPTTTPTPPPPQVTRPSWGQVTLGDLSAQWKGGVGRPVAAT